MVLHNVFLSRYLTSHYYFCEFDFWLVPKICDLVPN